MKLVSVIAEYNPFHLGHQYQLEQMKQRTSADALVVLMSGNVVQRGEFAVIDKWQRAEIALEYGADLVLELPLLASLQAADYFAYWSVKTLELLGSDQLVFGTESATYEALNSYVDWLVENEEAIDRSVRTYLNDGYSYAASYQSALEAIDNSSEKAKLLTDSPNHLLGIQYIKALKQLNSKMDVTAIPRIKHNENMQEVLSGSQIRELNRQQLVTEDTVPKRTFQKLVSHPNVQLADYYDLLKYQVQSQSAERLTQYQGINYGVEHYIYQQILETDNFDSLIDALTSKRWTKASIQRKLMMILLNITNKEWQESIELNNDLLTIRVLGYSDAGRKVLKMKRNQTGLNLFSNLTQDNARNYQLNLRADTVYSLNPKHKIMQQNTGRFPIHY